MRRRHCKLARIASVVLAISAAAVDSTRGDAQTGNPVEGAPEFLLPIGARTISLGLAAAATASGSDGLWWNPSVIARGPREASLHIARSFATTGGGADAGGGVIASMRGVGALGLSIHYVNEGESPATDTLQNQTGTFSKVTTIIAATVAAPFGDRFAAGLNVKFLQYSFPCTGSCNPPTNRPTTGALDLGAQYVVNSDSLIVLGAAVRSVGFKLQVNDADQADPLPARFDAGIAIAPKFSGMAKEARVRFAVDAITRISGGGGPGYRFGGELSWLNRLHARAGYILHDAIGSGPTLGFGLTTGRLMIDFAQARTDVGSDTGVQPTYLTLRYVF